MPRDLVECPEPQTPVVPVDEDGRILLRAADLLEGRGWVQCTIPGHCDGPGSLCMMNATGARGPDDRGRLAQRLGFRDTMRAYAWNDAPGRTKAEVLARLRSAAHAVPE